MLHRSAASLIFIFEDMLCAFRKKICLSRDTESIIPAPQGINHTLSGEWLQGANKMKMKYGYILKWIFTLAGYIKLRKNISVDPNNTLKGI